MEKYRPDKIESKWQNIWKKTGLNRTVKSKKPKYYCLDMFPYPSGEGLHVGHWRGYVLSDVWSRYKRLQGYNILHPMGWDAFGLPAENDAVKKKIHPSENTPKNIAVMKRQLHEIGAMYDWSREIDSSNPEYYKWTQWIFLQLYKKGLAYKKEAPVNWCPSCKTVLANEQVVNGLCERCDSEVEKKNLAQWFFKITKYADNLLKDLDGLEWPEKVKIMQRNWIGKSIGAEIIFKIKDHKDKIPVYTTRPDTLFGATYVVLAPENPQVEKLTTSGHKKEVEKYIKKTRKESEIERLSETKEKTGVFTGSYAINPVNDKEIPIWIADYVLYSYGTGAIMCVPAHDERDFEFAKKFKLPIIEVISPTGRSSGKLKQAYVETGKIINSEKFNGMKSEKSKWEITKWLAKKKMAKKKTEYRLRDWLISRQRYWGAPIPIVYCEKCGEVPIPEKDLPIKLPKDVDFKPTGESPLTGCKKFVNTKCPKCKGKARRETDTMDTFVCSSWYYLRYASSKYKKGPFDKKEANYWLPVDQYVGGVEHAIMHLLYARFFTKFLHTIGWVKFKEPFLRLFNQGMVVYKGAKMSKSKGNVVSPDEMINKYGADTVRAYELFMGPPEQDVEWSDQGIAGCFRFLNKVWQFSSDVLKVKGEKPVLTSDSSQEVTEIKIEQATHKTIKKITEDLERFHFNTVISGLMEFVNSLSELNRKLPYKKAPRAYMRALENLVILLAPVAPHFAEEIWDRLGNKESVFEASWPKYDKKLIKEDMMILIVQVNGKVRDKIEEESGISEIRAKEVALKSVRVQKFIQGTKIKKIIYVPGRLVNIVTRK